MHLHTLPEFPFYVTPFVQDGDGGALAFDNVDRAILDSCSFLRSTATARCSAHMCWVSHGGAVNFFRTEIVEVRSCTFSNSTSQVLSRMHACMHKYTHTLFLVRAPLSIHSLMFDVQDRGGALYVYRSENVTLSDCTFLQSTAKVHGMHGDCANACVPAQTHTAAIVGIAACGQTCL